MMQLMNKAHSTTAIILAAGQGTRMKGPRPKVLHELCGKPMIDYVIAASLEAAADHILVVVGHGRDAVTEHLGTAFGDQVSTAVQEQQRGTGHAVRCALPSLPAATSSVLLLYGDTPLLRQADLEHLLQTRAEQNLSLAMLTCRVADPTGYGRIIRDPQGKIVQVVEQRDADTEQLAIDEINPGIYATSVDFLCDALGRLTPDNDQGELYLTDIVAMAAAAGPVGSLEADAASLVGINDRHQLAEVEETMYRQIAEHWRRRGVTIRTGARIGGRVELAQDAIIEHDVVLRGATSIGARAHIDVGSVLTDVQVAADAYLKPYSVATEATVGPRCQVGPFAHLRPASILEAEAKVGNFVETKKTRLRQGAKASHLAYLGDGDVGPKANVGAGTIFCNYDGFMKHQTIIEQGAFIGSDSQIVAPVRIGANAYVGTGTTVTHDVPADALAIGRARQKNKEGYATLLREKLAEQKRAAQKTKT